MGRVLFFLTVAILIGASVGILLFNFGDIGQVRTDEVTINGTTFAVEIAQTDNQRAKGLAGTQMLEEKTGMLFIIPEDQKETVTFWMKDMVMPIDIIWIADDTIVQIDRNVQPEPGVADEYMKQYSSIIAPDKVLEIGAGESVRYQLAVGQEVQ